MRSSRKIDGSAAGDEGHLAEALDEGVEAIFDRFGEDERVELEGGAGAGLGGLGLADDLDRFLGVAALVALEVDLAIPPDFDLAPLRKGVDGADAHPVQPAGDLVAAAAELAAGVQLGHHHLEGRLFLGGVHVHRDAAPVIVDGDGRYRRG